MARTNKTAISNSEKTVSATTKKKATRKPQKKAAVKKEGFFTKVKEAPGKAFAYVKANAKPLAIGTVTGLAVGAKVAMSVLRGEDPELEPEDQNPPIGNESVEPNATGAEPVE